MTRAAVLLTVILALVCAPAAFAQSGGGGAFGPLPPPAPVETPTPEPPDQPDDGKVSRSTLLLVGLGVIVVFGGLGIAITRDARRSLTEDDRAALERDPDSIAHKKSRQAKARARQKAKAQRKARRHNRPR